MEKLAAHRRCMHVCNARAVCDSDLALAGDRPTASNRE